MKKREKGRWRRWKRGGREGGGKTGELEDERREDKMEGERKEGRRDKQIGRNIAEVERGRIGSKSWK